MMTSVSHFPRHVAIIMDGNGRWAQKRGLPRITGHQEGAHRAQDIIRYCHELKIPFVTLYAFSQENWKRPAAEIRSIFKILSDYLNHDPNKLIKNGIKLNPIGNIKRLPRALSAQLTKLAEKTKTCSKQTLTLALSYSSWWEILEAMKQIGAQIKKGDLDPTDICPELLRSSLKTYAIPDPDLVIRTSGEARLSNFLLLQIGYSELHFSPKLWPDFARTDFDHALTDFAQRARRFGS